MRQEVLVGVERRRRWSVERKLDVLAEVGVDGATVADVARRHDITRQHLYQWRREMRRKFAASQEPPKLLPVELSEGDPVDAASAPARQAPLVAIELRNGRTVRAAADLPEPLLMRVIRVAEQA